MSDPIVNQWRQQGMFYLWRNPENERGYPGWDCTVEEAARLSLLDLCERMQAAKFSAKRAVLVAPFDPHVARLPGPPVTKRFFSPDKVTIVYPRDEVEQTHFRWSGDPRQPVLTLGSEKLAQLRRAFEQLADYGDFCICADDQMRNGYDFERSAIWFWQLFDSTVPAKRHVSRNQS